MYVIILMFLVLFLFAPSTHMLPECADVKKKIELPLSLTSHTAHTVSTSTAAPRPLKSFKCFCKLLANIAHMAEYGERSLKAWRRGRVKCTSWSRKNTSAAHRRLEVCLCIVPLLSHCVRIFFGIRGFSSNGATQRLLYRKRPCALR